MSSSAEQGTCLFPNERIITVHYSVRSHLHNRQHNSAHETLGHPHREKRVPKVYKEHSAPNTGHGTRNRRVDHHQYHSYEKRNHDGVGEHKQINLVEKRLSTQDGHDQIQSHQHPERYPMSQGPVVAEDIVKHQHDATHRTDNPQQCGQVPLVEMEEVPLVQDLDLNVLEARKSERVEAEPVAVPHGLVVGPELGVFDRRIADGTTC